MIPLLNYIGLVNIIFFGSTVYLLIKRSNIDLKKHTVSWLGDDKKLGYFFNLSLFMFAIGQVVFSIIVTNTLASTNNYIIPLFLLGGLTLCLASILTTGKHHGLHQFMSALSALLVGSGVIILSFTLISSNTILGLVTLGASIFVLISFLLRSRLTGAYWEFILFTGIAIWNIALSIPLIVPFG